MSTHENAGSTNVENTHNVMAPKDTVPSSSKKTTARGQGTANAAREEKAVNTGGGVETVNAVGGREAANALFKKGQVADARDAYMSLMANEADQAELAALHNNLSACYKRLGDDEGAVRHAKECLERDPVHAKSHLRLAQMCIGKEQKMPKHNEVDPRKHLMAAAALLGQRHPEVTPLLEKAEERNVAIVLAKTTFDVSVALWSVCSSTELIIVLFPGTYDKSNHEPVFISGAGVKVWLLGLGRVLFIKGLEQILFIDDNASGHVENLVIHCTPEKSCLSCFGCQNAFLHLKGCRFRGHQVLTVTSSGHGLIDQCHFEKMCVHGAEVRSSGSLVVTQCHFEQCEQGLIAHGGAKYLRVESTMFEGCEKEAIFLTGELTNAACRAKDNFFRSHQRREAEQKLPINERHFNPVSAMLETSEAAGKVAIETGTAGLLYVRVERCHFRLNRQLAVSCNNGARAELLGCLFERTDDSAEAKLARCVEEMRIGLQALGMPIPARAVLERSVEDGFGKPSAGVFISSGAPVRMAYCVFNANDAAVYIDYNFDACVRLEKCAFYENNKDVVEFLKPGANGMWSKPAVITEKRTIARAEEVPTLESLSAAVDVFETHLPSQSHAVPSLPLVSGNPARCSFVQADPIYYPIGNTFGYDVLQHSISVHIETAVFLACGDIRNVAETLAGWWDRHADDNARVELTMNDASLSILARNIVLLELLARGVSSTIVRDVWGAATWNEATYQVFKDTLARAREPWLECDADVEAVMRAWANATLQPKHVVETFPYLSLERSQATKLTCQDVGETHRKEVEKYLSALTFDTGSTMHANPTLLEGEGLKPSMYPTSSLFRAIGPLRARRKMLGSTLLRHIESYVLRCGAALRSGRVHIRVFHGDAFDFPLRPRADAVEVSNLADYVGFANVLLLGARCGNRIFAQSMHRRYELSHTRAQEQFFVDCFGISSAAFFDLIGLKRVRSDVCSSGILWTEWIRAPRNMHAVPRALNAAKLAKHMCAPVQEYRSGGVSANTGVTCAALIGPRICEATAPLIAQAECSLMFDACARTLRLPCSSMDYFTARLNYADTFAVAITEFSPAVGDMLQAKTIRSLFHVVRFHDVGPCVDLLVPAKFPRTGHAALVRCNADIVCVAEPKKVALLTDVGPAPATLRALSCYTEENYPFIDGRNLEWRLVAQRRVEEDGEAVAEVDVAFPPGTRGVDVVAKGDTLLFSADGETVLTVVGDALFGARKNALSSPKLGLLTCSFVVNTSRVRGG